MSAVFDKPSLLQRAAPLFQGFDGPLALAVLLLSCASLPAKQAAALGGLLGAGEAVLAPNASELRMPLTPTIWLTASEPGRQGWLP